jgi:lipoprotein-releasing system permease protein
LIVGQELARALRLVVGDRVTVVSPQGDLGPSGPIPRARPFRIAGIFYSGMYEYDMKHAYVDLRTAQRFLRAGERITGIEIKVADVQRAPALAAELASSLGRDDLRVRDWKEMNQQLFGALALEKLAMFITLGIAVVIAGFSVFGTLTLLVQEKRREVGILKAMGTPARGVIRIFVIEGLLIGTAGGLMGLGLGFVMTFAAEHFGIRMNPEVYYIDKLPVNLDPTEFALVGASTVVVCLAATLFPAYQASRVRPVDALRYD